jgi:hypothetical protein
MQTVIETEMFLRAAAKAGMTDAEREKMVSETAANPAAGDLIQGTGGYRKVRFAKTGKGKSGGYRVITLYVSADIPVFLITVYAKNQLGNLSAADKNALKKIAKDLLQYP